MAIHSSIFARKIPWREEPVGLQSIGSQRLVHDWAYTSSLLIKYELVQQHWHYVETSEKSEISDPTLSSVQSLSRVRLFATPWTAARQASPSITNSRSLLKTHVHWVGDAIQPSHPLSSPSPPALNLSQHQCLFKWVSSSHQVAKVLEFQIQHQSFQCLFRTDFL